MNNAEYIADGKATIGIEFGSTRIKAVLIGEDFSPLASGVYDWNNSLIDGIWTYSLDEVRIGLQGCFADLQNNVKAEYGVPLKRAAAMGISAMMHGYLAFDAQDRLLVPFRTWRNTMTEEAAEKLTKAFSFNIPQRWSIAHLYQAILNNEPHIAEIAHLTTLAGYVHYLLTGERVLGIGDASGMFPIAADGKNYDQKMLYSFSKLTEKTAFTQNLAEILPTVAPVGETAGRLTEAGAKLLDPTGIFEAGVPFCPPEGDAQTGMTATNSITPCTGNVSAGTSIFAMTVLERGLSDVYREIDIVTTPCGSPVAMVHCNNCTTDLDAWVRMFDGFLRSMGMEVPKSKLYDTLYTLAVGGDADCGGVLSYNYYSGEHVTGLSGGMPLMMRTPTADFTIENLMRSLVYSCMATLKIGMDILTKQEHITLTQIYAHGGLFKSPIASQRFLSAALGVDVTLMQSAGEGGAWGIALLAAYMVRKERSESLSDYLNTKVFAAMNGSRVSPIQTDVDGLNAYMSAYRDGLSVERAAVCQNQRKNGD